MTDMTGNILNRVRRLPKPTKPAQTLQPLFEAVSNAMHAIEDQFQATAITSGHVNITIANPAAPARSQIIIADNGIGLTNDRFLAFCTTDTDFKLPRGGKGIGRLLWLDAFDRIKVTSIFEEGVRRLQRSFRFQLSPLDQITDETIEPAIACRRCKTSSSSIPHFNSKRPKAFLRKHQKMQRRLRSLRKR